MFLNLPTQALPVIDPIHTDKCGIEKGCYRVPEGCWEPYCDYIATWRPLSRVGVEYMIEMSARVDGITDRHVSLALSDDIRWVGLQSFPLFHQFCPDFWAEKILFKFMIFCSVVKLLNTGSYYTYFMFLLHLLWKSYQIASLWL